MSAQACAAAERHRHAAAPLSGTTDAAPAGLHPHLHGLRQLQPQTHRRDHLPSSGRAQETHRLSGVSAIYHHHLKLTYRIYPATTAMSSCYLMELTQSSAVREEIQYQT